MIGLGKVKAERNGNEGDGAEGDLTEEGPGGEGGKSVGGPTRHNGRQRRNGRNIPSPADGVGQETT